MPSVPVYPNMIVYPSGVLLAICLAATVPPAPARWSTMTCWPSVSESLSAMIRAMMPVLPPGGKVSTIVIGRIGYACASAKRGTAGSAATAEARRRNCLRWGSFTMPFQSSSAIAGYQRVTYTARALFLAHCPLLTLLRPPMSAMAAGFRRVADMSSDDIRQAAVDVAGGSCVQPDVPPPWPEYERRERPEFRGATVEPPSWLRTRTRAVECVMAFQHSDEIKSLLRPGL